MKLYVSRVSPYCSKVEAMLAWAGLDFERITQTAINRYGVIRRLTGQTRVPVLREESWALNDSTRIAHYALGRSVRPMLPRDDARALLNWLLEEFADEWLYYIVGLSRWCQDEDARQSAAAEGEELAGGVPLLGSVLGRVALDSNRGRLREHGVSEKNRAAILGSRDRLFAALEELLRDGGFLMEAHPTVADFAFYGMLEQFRRDPGGRRIVAAFPHIDAYLDRVAACATSPEAFEEATAARTVSTLRVLFAEFLGTYWRVLAANHRAITSQKFPSLVRVTMLDGRPFELAPRPYLVGRLRHVLRLLDEAYQSRNELFSRQGLALEAPLIEAVAELARYEGGRELFRDYPHIAKI